MSPFELMYGVPPQMDYRAVTGASLIIPSLDHRRRLEVLAGSVPREVRSGASVEKKLEVSSPHFFEVGDELLFARRTSFDGTKWPALVSKFYGPCRVLRVRHP